MGSLRQLTMALCIGFIATTAGCDAWYDESSKTNYGSIERGNTQNASRMYQTRQQYTKVSHKVSKLELNQYLSGEVQAMYGVNSAHVLVGDNVAYVGITIDGTATGTRGGNGHGKNEGGPSNETNNIGIVKGLYNPYRPMDDTANPDELATGVNGPDTVMHHDNLSHMLKQRIAERIRSADPTIQDVYISANRVFVNELNRLAQENWKGHSLDPYRSQFTRLATEIFGTDPTIPNQAENNGK